MSKALNHLYAVEEKDALKKIKVEYVLGSWA